MRGAAGEMDALCIFLLFMLLFLVYYYYYWVDYSFFFFLLFFFFVVFCCYWVDYSNSLQVMLLSLPVCVRACVRVLASCQFYLFPIIHCKSCYCLSAVDEEDNNNYHKYKGLGFRV